MYLRKLLWILFIFLPLALGAETLLELQKELLRNNPEISAARNRYLAVTKVAIQEGTLPDPAISFTDFGVGHPFSTLNASDFAYRGIGVSQDFPFPGKLSLRSQVAKKSAEAAQQELRATEIRLLSELKTSVVEQFYLQRALEIQAKYRELLDHLIETSEARYRVGEGLQQDVLRAMVERSSIEEKLLLLRQDLERESSAINALLSRDVSAPLKAEGDFPALRPVPEFEALVQKLSEQAPEVVVRRKQEEQSQLQLRLAKKERYPDFTTTFQWQKTGSEFPDYYMTMVEARIPLYFWRKQKSAIAQAQLELKAIQDQTKATLLRLLNELKQAYVTATTTATLTKLYNEGIVPQSRLSLESALSAYQVGKIEFVSVLNNATTLLNYENESLRRSADHGKAIARIEQVTGTLLDPQESAMIKELEP